MKYFLYLVVVVASTACSSNVVNIDAKDSVSFSTFEASFPVSDKKDKWVKIRSSKASGSYSQTVPAGKLVIIDGNQIAGPDDVQGTTDLTYHSISYGGEIVFEDFLHEENTSSQDLSGIWSIGVSRTDLDLTLLHGGNRYRISDKAPELFGQVGLRYPMTQSLSGALTLGLGVGKNLLGIGEYDLRFNYQLARQLGIIFGFRRVEYYYLIEDESSIDVTFSGPFAGLNLSL